jgi:hypothetical protein
LRLTVMAALKTSEQFSCVSNDLLLQNISASCGGFYSPI